MVSFKKYLRSLKKKKKKQPLPGQFTSVRKDSSTMHPTAMLPAGTGGNQPRLS